MVVGLLPSGNFRVRLMVDGSSTPRCSRSRRKPPSDSSPRAVEQYAACPLGSFIDDAAWANGLRCDVKQHVVSAHARAVEG